MCVCVFEDPESAFGVDRLSQSGELIKKGYDKCNYIYVKIIDIQYYLKASVHLKFL